MGSGREYGLGPWRAIDLKLEEENQSKSHRLQLVGEVTPMTMRRVMITMTMTIKVVKGN